MAEFHIVEPARLAAVWPRVLAAPGARRADAAQLAAFEQYVRATPARCLAWAVSTAPDSPSVAALLLPGRTALLLVPAVAPRDAADPQRALVAHALAELAAHNLHYVQALIEPDARGRAALLAAAGLRRITTLDYLHRRVTYPWSDPPQAPDLTWTAYSAQSRAAFATTILASYADSADCPELTGLRPIDDVLASHQASGEFTPELWQLACIAGAPAGCVLLAPLSGSRLVDLVYMGVTPRFRRRGVGRLLLQRALELSRARQANGLTVVVDHRNMAARRLYESFALRCTVQREAYLSVPARAT